jgi:hypothetical protein
LREYLAHYTYKPNPIQRSIIIEEEIPEQPFTRFSAYTFLLVGYALSLGIGLYIGSHAQDFFGNLRLLFQHTATTVPVGVLAFDLIIYPPIAVLIIDTVQGLAARID